MWSRVSWLFRDYFKSADCVGGGGVIMQIHAWLFFFHTYLEEGELINRKLQQLHVAT